ncbi:TPA: hypothetical protein DEP21_00135, partial [Patescibacteria group bacterium]|nr:hypothetical protein [Candidatus Gracilibacteria bacterium]
MYNIFQELIINVTFIIFIHQNIIDYRPKTNIIITQIKTKNMENNPETKSPPFTEGRRKEIARSIVNGERFPMKERLNN